MTYSIPRMKPNISSTGERLSRLPNGHCEGRDAKSCVSTEAILCMFQKILLRENPSQ
ncbi:MAG: hypothetical protein JETT_1833 [Candidatus Jettenia ecosi]|uniref:Uncharacterized protein n=1 Tax=Candidatus Jettenia ecosi TaxID=2494326 RepID=A0A533QB48_9BACT|nr:MAG: hypothetical protein JETT_1833 [Candidatus Jettenia ecosi]